MAGDVSLHRGRIKRGFSEVTLGWASLTVLEFAGLQEPSRQRGHVSKDKERRGLGGWGGQKSASCVA